jgi:hypothetical protein
VKWIFKTTTILEGGTTVEEVEAVGEEEVASASNKEAAEKDTIMKIGSTTTKIRSLTKTLFHVIPTPNMRTGLLMEKMSIIEIGSLKTQLIKTLLNRKPMRIP